VAMLTSIGDRISWVSSLQSEQVAEFLHGPTSCRREYRVVVVRKNLAVEKDEWVLFDQPSRVRDVVDRLLFSGSTCLREHSARSPLADRASGMPVWPQTTSGQLPPLWVLKVQCSRRLLVPRLQPGVHVPDPSPARG